MREAPMATHITVRDGDVTIDVIVAASTLGLMVAVYRHPVPSSRPWSPPLSSMNSCTPFAHKSTTYAIAVT